MQFKPFFKKYKWILIIVTIIVLLNILFCVTVLNILFWEGKSYEFLYESRITIPTGECEFSDYIQKGTYGLDLDVIDFEKTKTEMEEIITTYGGIPKTTESTTYSGDSVAGYAEITAEIPANNTENFIKEIRKFTDPPNITYYDDLFFEDSGQLRDYCDSMLSDIQRLAEKERLYTFALNNMDSLSENELITALEDLSIMREEAKFSKEEIYNLSEGLNILEISIYIQEILGREE